jgi:hypothetical protein
MLAMVHRRWFTMGFFTALATLCWQPVLFVATAGAVIAVVLGQSGGRLKALARFAVGGLVPTAVTVGCYAAVGAFDIFWDDFFLINARYTQQISLVTNPDEAWRMLVEGYGPSLWLFLIGLAAITVLAVRALWPTADRRDAVRVNVLATGAILVAGVAWSLRAFNGFPDAFIMLPPAALGVGGLVAGLASRVSLRTAVLATAAWTVAATAIGATYAISTRDDTLVHQRASVDAVLDALPPGSRILSVEAPQPLVLARQRNPSRLQLFGNGLIDYVDDTWPGGRDGYGRWVGRQRPTLIALGNHGSVPDWLDPTLVRDYHRVGTSIGWDWWVHKDVGRHTRDELRRIVKDTYVPVG